MSNVWLKCGKVYNLTPAAGVTATGAQTGIYKDSPFATFQASVVGTGAVSATVNIEVSNDNTYWCSSSLGTITLSGTTSNADGFSTSAPWKYVRANITSVAGTGATVTVTMGV